MAKSTRELVAAWRRHDPYATATEIRDGLAELGRPVSRQRVQQLLAALGLPSIPPPRPPSIPPALRRQTRT